MDNQNRQAKRERMMQELSYRERMTIKLRAGELFVCPTDGCDFYASPDEMAKHGKCFSCVEDDRHRACGDHACKWCDAEWTHDAHESTISAPGECPEWHTCQGCGMNVDSTQEEDF